MALLLATDGLKINVCILQGVLHDIPFYFLMCEGGIKEMHIEGADFCS